MPWTIRTHGTVKRFQASFPALTSNPVGAYVTVSAGGMSEILKKTQRAGAGGDQIFVSSRSSLPEGQTATVEEEGALRYHWFRIWHDGGLKLAAGGLVMGVIGITIDAARDLGQTWPLITVSSSWMAASKAFGYMLKAIGLLIVFAGALLKDDG